ncbi:MAG: DUF2179 domain-containing protein [Nanoarchaeota archaeon]
MDILNSGAYTWIVMPILIFIARICDVSIGTIKLILISRGYKFIAPLLAFFEILIWLLAIRQIMLNLTNIFCYLAYAFGFAFGTFIGMFLEEKISLGKVIIRIITKKDAIELVKSLKDLKYKTTIIEGNGIDGKVRMVFSILDRKNIPKVVDTIKKFNPTAFYSIEDVRFVNDRIVENKPYFSNLISFYRKSK